MELNIQKLLRNDSDALNKIKALGIDYRIHPRFPNLIQFTYDQIESASNKADLIVCESRGLILDSMQNWHVVSHGLNRFFNYGEVGSAEIDWKSAKIFEKVDGSMLVVYWYAGAWHVSTKGTPDANCNVGEFDITFEKLFWKSFYNQYRIIGKSIDNLIPGWTYVFELTSKYNRIVTTQIDNEGFVTLLAIRNQAGDEVDVNVWAEQFTVVKQFNINTVDAVIEAAKNLDPLSQEGFVVVDKDFNRVKIKSPGYVMIHHLKDSINPRRLVDLIKIGERDECLVYFPDLELRYNGLQAKMVDTGMKADFWFLQVKNYNNTRKEFALKVQEIVPKPLWGAMFVMITKQVNGFAWLCSQTSTRVIEILENLNE
jgi:hypothetical protein